MMEDTRFHLLMVNAKCVVRILHYQRKESTTGKKTAQIFIDERVSYNPNSDEASIRNPTEISEETY
jgi:hypothetical protein